MAIEDRDMEAHAVTDLGTLDQLGSDAVSHAQRSLQLLRDIENTISALCYERRFFVTMAAAAHDTADRLKLAPRKAPLDPEGRLEDKFDKAQAAAKQLYEAMIEKRSHARNDPNLTDEDGIADEYSRSIAAVADLHNGLNALRWAIGEYDADLEKPSGKTFKDPEQLDRFLAGL
jgi:hypothetical protein